MSDVKIPESIPCKFNEKGWAPCGKPTTNGRCSEHEKIKCVSCGRRAELSCDATMGGLTCGMPLCRTCQHDTSGKHVTRVVYAAQMKEIQNFRTTGLESKRMLEERGVPTNILFPRNLKDLLEGDRTGWTCKRCWALELKHGLMGFFPAIVKATPKIMLIVSDRDSIFRVWKSLEPRDSKIIALECMVNEAGNVGYVMRLENEEEKRRSLPLKVFGASEISDFFATDPSPFEWAPGLLGSYINKVDFNILIEREEKK